MRQQSFKASALLVIALVLSSATSAQDPEDEEIQPSKTSKELPISIGDVIVEEIPILEWDDEIVEGEPAPPQSIMQLLELDDLKPYPSYPDSEPNCQDRTINRWIRVYPLDTRTQGDGEMGGSNTAIRVRGGLQVTPGRVYLNTLIEMHELSGDFSRYQRSLRGSLFDVNSEAPGCRITGISGVQKPSNAQWYSGTNEHRFLTYKQEDAILRKGDLITSATCRVDTKGNDDGNIGCPYVKLKSFTVRLQPIDLIKACDPIPLDLPIGPTVYGGIKLGTHGMFPLYRKSGDAKLGKNNRLIVFAIAWANSRFAMLLERASISEEKGDRTTYGKSQAVRIFDARHDAPGCNREIEKIEWEGAASSWIDRWVREEGYQIIKPMSKNSIMSSAHCIVNTPGKDDGKVGCPSFDYRDNTRLWVKFRDSQQTQE